MKTSGKPNRSNRHNKSVDNIPFPKTSKISPTIPLQKQFSPTFAPKKSLNQSILQARSHKSASRVNIKKDDFVGYMDNQLENLSKRKEKMEVCIDLFNLMHSNNMHLRCMQHNNTLTLYCLTQRRILCVNCTYGVAKHRTHKVLPLKDASTQVADDNILLREIINNDLRALDESLRNSQQNSQLLEKEMKRMLQSFEQAYEMKFLKLKQKYENDKKNIRNSFESILTKTKTLQKSIEQFKFKIWQTLSKIGIGKRNEATSNQTQVVRQVFCVNLSQLTKFQVRRMTKKQLQRYIQKLSDR